MLSSGSATSISLRFAPHASSFASVLIGSERLLAPCPCGLPVASVACRSEVAGVESGKRVLEVADFVVLGSARIDTGRARGRLARCGVQGCEHLVMGDEEVLGAGDACLDLDPDRASLSTPGEDVEARVC